MDTILYLFFTGAYIALFIWGLIGINKKDIPKWTSFIYLIILALIYDNGIIGIGKWIGEGPLLETLNLMRFWTHAFLTPLLVLFAIGTLKESGIAWAEKKWVSLVAIIYTVILIGIEIWLETFQLTLKAEEEYGVLRYVSAEESSGPPVMILLVTLILIVASAILWKKTKWVIFFIGAVVMTIGSAVPIDVDSGAVTNAFELFLLFTLVWTKRRLIKDKLHSD
ncbi:hypothetical protein [Psychrobacillus sp. MER TA 171]|uniref:hypothetical protein n=1 Tax=Psychrobacillus sp. MER TA 171 TaxID=2939577 RepID=UPI00203D1265|nr:hypothetical protein [Psychrobacillus sp. MER TA 171]MCM3359139.1 hypothetical protein [Psychrobacillus sp. MER TA 171]